MVKVDQRRFAEAVPWLEKSVSTPALADMGELPYRMMGYCYLATGKVPEAIPHPSASTRYSIVFSPSVCGPNDRVVPEPESAAVQPDRDGQGPPETNDMTSQWDFSISPGACDLIGEFCRDGVPTGERSTGSEYVQASGWPG